MPLGFLRGVVGAIGIGCAYMLARSVLLLRREQLKIGRMYAWLLRTLVCLLAVWYPARPGVDSVDMVVWLLALIAFVLGYWGASRVKKQEDLTHEIFPDSNEDPTNPASREP